VCHSRAVGAIIGDDIGAEGAHHSCSLFADTPEPDYTDDGSIKSAPPMLVTFRPAPGADELVLDEDIVGEPQEERDRRMSHRSPDCFWGVGERHALRDKRADVNGIDA